MSSQRPLPTKLLIFISLTQGLALLLLHQSIEFKFWPHTSPQWLFCFYAMTLTGPTLLLLGLTKEEITIFRYIVPFTLISGLMGLYIGYQTTPIEHIKYNSLLFGMVTTMAIASFKVLMYTQQFISGKAFTYSQLFQWSWRNFLTLALSLLFAASFWGVLMLWAGLFKAIKIHFFYDLFTEKWFYYPAVSLAHGVGVVIFRNQSKVIDTIKTLQQALMKFLLVILVFVSILFLCTLSISGLEPLWDSGGSFLILWMQALILFFINAVYQDDPQHRPYNIWIHRFIYLGVGLLPIYSIISFYGLSIRVDQHGWSIMRCWAFLIWFLLAVFSAGYLWGIIKLKDNWLEQLSKVNIVMGLVVLVSMILVNSPLLDFRKISVKSQLARLDTSEVSVEGFSVYYFRNHLARPGYDALQTLKDKYAESKPLLAAKITRLYTYRSDENIGLTQEQFINQINVISGDFPEKLETEIFTYITKNRWVLRNAKSFSILAVDLNQDDQQEFLFIQESKNSTNLSFFTLVNEKWVRHSITKSRYGNLDKAATEALKSGDFELIQPQWMELKINDKLYQVMTNSD